MVVKCPRCGKTTDMTGNAFRPFCSERCRAIDLGNWFFGKYRIPERSTEEDDGESRAKKDSDQK